MPREMPSNACAGFSLVELLIATALGLVILAAAYQGFLAQQRIMAAQEQVTEMQQSARAAMEFITRELRMAREDATTKIELTVDPAGNSSITFQSELDDFAYQRKGFALADSTLYYVRRAQDIPDLPRFPLAENMERLEIIRGKPEDNTQNLFTVTLTARTAYRDPSLKDYRRVTLTSKVRPRNLP